jgi:PAS domain S-box-containing protein
MTTPVRILYLATDPSTGEWLESGFEDDRPRGDHPEDDRPAVAFSYVTSVEQALAVLEAERIDHLVVDPTFADRETEVGGIQGIEEVERSKEIEEIGEIEEIDKIEGIEDIEELSELTSKAGSETRVATDGGLDGESFHALAEALSDGLLVIDADSTIQFANSAVEDVFGYRPEELVGRSLTELMSADLAERHRDGIQRYLQEGERHLDWNYVELPGRHCDGHEVPLAVSFSEFTADRKTLFTGIVRDVSDRRHRDAELRARMKQRDALATFSRHALEDRPLADLMDEATDLVADVLDHEHAGVLEYRPDEDDLLVRVVTGWPEELVDFATIGTTRDSLAGYALLAEEAVVTENLAAEGRFDRDGLLESMGVTSGIAVIVGSPDDPWGVIGVHDTDEQSYADHDVQFVQGVARLLTSAIRRKEREQQLEQYETMLNAVGDGVYALDADSRFVAVNDAYVEMTGYGREELLGEHASKAIGDGLYEDARWIQDAIEGGRDVVTTEATIQNADGESIPTEVRVAPLHMADVNGRVGVVRDVSGRKRREEKLTSLNEMLESLADAESATEICDLGVNAAVETLGFPNAAVALYDDEANTLVSTVRRWEGGDIDDALLGSHAADVAWQTFVEGESRAYEDLHAELDPEMRMASAIVVPLGRYGVFLAASPERDAFDRTDRSLADMLCSNVRSALDRADREETLRNQRNELEAKNRELERVNRLNRVIREMTKALTQASSQENVIRAVCDRLTEAGPYRFAWFGDHDRATDEIRPRASAGVEEEYLEEVVVKADQEDDRGQGPAGRAVRSKEVQVQNDLLGDPPFEPWREQALKRGYRSSAAVPVVYSDTLRGVLNLYADEPNVFNETEREVLAELGEFVGYALNALEQKQALASEQSIELDFRIRGTESPVLSFVTESDAEFEFENAVQRADGGLQAFFTVRGVAPAAVLDHAEDLLWISDVRLVTESEGEGLYECSVGEQSFLQRLVDHGAMPRTLTASGGKGRFVIRVPRSASVRTFVDLFENYYEEVELVARREVDEPVMTRQEFEAELAERLTERQREVLQMAYFGGFFEWPRESTAEEIADTLDVSQPTVSRHVRGAERALFGLLFEDR